MPFRIIIIVLSAMFIWNIGYCQEDTIYTWKDKNGVLNITDAPPPPDAELLDSSPGHRKEAEAYQLQLMEKEKRSYREQQRKIVEQQATEARQKEADAARRADELYQKAEEMTQGVEGPKRVKRRVKNRASELVNKAQKAEQQAVAAGKKADALEKQLGNQ